MNNNNIHGTVVRVFPERGYMFVSPDKGGKDIFCLINDGCRIVLDLKSAKPEFESGFIKVPVFESRVVIEMSHIPNRALRWGYEHFFLKAKQAAENIPEFRIMKQHSFQNGGARPALIHTGPMKLPLLLSEISRGRVQFKSEETYHNRTTKAWFERREGKEWIRDDSPLGVVEPKVALVAA